ncbi:hypothetical protein K1719_038602 [Acacia pycnantha]|nr:hypothetical protein K1719_038602 [Acacia pycnantha]
MWKDKTTSYPPVAIFPPFCNPRGWHKTLRWREQQNPSPSIISLHFADAIPKVKESDCVALGRLGISFDFCAVSVITTGVLARLCSKTKRRPSQHPLEVIFLNGNRIHIYFDHCIAVLDIISPAEEDDGMFSHEEESDSYESAEDEAYKTPPPGVDDDAEDDEEQCRPKKKSARRAMTIAKRIKEDVSEEESLVHEEGANEEEANDSFDENGYEYDSEELKTPRSSDDEEHDSETLAQFNEKAEFGHVYLELGMEFVGVQGWVQAIHWIGWLFLEGILWRAVIECCGGMPRAHHRFCVQHVWKNFMKQWRYKQLRALLWECARCTTIPKFERTMQKLKALNEASWKYLANIEPGA